MNIENLGGNTGYRDTNGNFRAEKYSKWNKNPSGLRTAEWIGQRKASVNLKIELWKLPNLNNRHRLEKNKQPQGPGRPEKKEKK